jgi:PAS domain S-box-containing protein
MLKSSSDLADEAKHLQKRFSPEQLATLVALGPTWLWETGPDHAFTFFSPAMEAATGIPVDSLIGRTRAEAFLKQGVNTPEVKQHLADLEAKRPFSDFMFQSTTADGMTIWVAASGAPQFDENQIFTGYMGVARLVTDQSRAVIETQRRERALASAASKSRRQILTALEGLSTGFALWDTEFNLVAANSRFSDLFAPGLHVEPGENYQAVMRQLIEANQVRDLRGIETEKWLEIDYLRMRSTDEIEDIYQLSDNRWVLRRVTTAASGERVDIRTDISDLKAKEQALSRALKGAEAADRAKSEFLAHMSHEFRTPMNGVLGMTELLAGSTLTERQSMFVDVIRQSGQSLMATLNSIIDFTKLDSGSMDVDIQTFPLRVALEDEVERLVGDADAKDIDLMLDIDPALPALVESDETLLRQAVGHLVSNAVKFTDDGMVTVRVEGTVTDNASLALTISVVDTGCGIAPDKIDAVFEKFAMVQAVGDNRLRGIGLGLSLVSAIAERLGGQCTLTSELGVGSVFTLSIPMRCHGAQSPIQAEPYENRKHRVLVIDQTEEWRNSISRPLKYWGYDVAAVPDAQTAIALATKMFERGDVIDIVFIGCESRQRHCLVIARELDAGLPFAPPQKILIAPPEGLVTQRDIQIHRVSSVIPMVLRQAALHHQVKAALEAKPSKNTDAGAAPQQREPIDAGTDHDNLALVETMPKPNVSAQDLATAAGQIPIGTSIDVLVIEDNTLNQMALLQMLSVSGRTYEICADAKTALLSLATTTPSLILLDLTLPDADALALLATIRDAGINVPVIALTSATANMDSKTCLANGFNDVLVKPLTPDALSQTLVAHLKSPNRMTA